MFCDFCSVLCKTHTAASMHVLFKHDALEIVLSLDIHRHQEPISSFHVYSSGIYYACSSRPRSRIPQGTVMWAMFTTRDVIFMYDIPWNVSHEWNQVYLMNGLLNLNVSPTLSNVNNLITICLCLFLTSDYYDAGSDSVRGIPWATDVHSRRGSWV